MQIAKSWLAMLRRFGQKAGPYLMLEMLLPGGTLLALLLLVWQRRRPDIGRVAPRAVLVVIRALTGVFEQCILAPAPIRVTTGVPESGPTERL